MDGALTGICLNPQLQAGCDTRSVFKQCKAGVNSDFFPLLDLLPNQCLSAIAGGKQNKHAFPKGK